MHKREFIAGLTGFGASAALSSRLTGAAASAPASPPVFYNIRDFGAVGDGVKLDTSCIQATIDHCSRQGGGVVIFPPGRFLSGSLFLRNGVLLEIGAGAVLLGSTQLQDYTVHSPALRSYTDNYVERCLIYGENLKRVGLCGRGIIDGQGAAFKGPYKVRPYMIRLVACREVEVRDITLRDSPMWVQHYMACEDVLIDGVKVFSRCNHNNDGIDIDGCQRVIIANCNISSGDDAIVLKSTLDRPCKDVTVTNCLLSSLCNAFKLGTESNGGFFNIAMSNCAIYDTRLAGIALEMVDGGVLDGVNISNVTMQDVVCPIFIRLGNRARPFLSDGPRPGMGKLKNILISNVQATGANKTGCSITGLPDHPAELISLDNIRLSFSGGGTAADHQREVPENADKYPEFAMFGTLPSYGFYCRHVRGLKMSNVQLSVVESDARPPLLADDVEDFEITRLDASASGAGPVIHLKNNRQVFIHGCRSPKTAVMVQVDGKASAGIRLIGNETSQAQKPFQTGKEVSSGAVS